MAKTKVAQKNKSKKTSNSAPKASASKSGEKDSSSGGDGNRMRKRKKSSMEVYKARHNIGKRTAAGRVASYRESEVTFVFPDGYFRPVTKIEPDCQDEAQKSGLLPVKEEKSPPRKSLKDDTKDNEESLSPEVAPRGRKASKSQSASPKRAASSSEDTSKGTSKVKRDSSKSESSSKDKHNKDTPPKGTGSKDKHDKDTAKSLPKKEKDTPKSASSKQNSTPKGASNKDKQKDTFKKTEKLSPEKTDKSPSSPAAKKLSKPSPKASKDKDKQPKKHVSPQRTSDDVKSGGAAKQDVTKSNDKPAKGATSKQSGSAQSSGKQTKTDDKSLPNQNKKTQGSSSVTKKGNNKAKSKGAMQDDKTSSGGTGKSSKFADLQPRAIRIKRTACLNAGAIMYAMYKDEPAVKKPKFDGDSTDEESDMSIDSTSESESLTSSEDDMPKRKSPVRKPKVAAKKVKKAPAWSKGKKVKVKMKGKGKVAAKGRAVGGKGKPKGRKKKVESSDEGTTSSSSSSESESESEEENVPLWPPPRRMASLNAQAILEASKDEPRPKKPRTSTGKGKKALPAKEPDADEKGSDENEEESKDKSTKENDKVGDDKSKESAKQTKDSTKVTSTSQSQVVSASGPPVTQALAAARSPTVPQGASVTQTSPNLRPTLPTPSPDVQILEVKPPAFSASPRTRTPMAGYPGHSIAQPRASPSSGNYMPTSVSSYNYSPPSAHTSHRPSTTRYPGPPVQQPVPPHARAYSLPHQNQRGYHSSSAHHGYQGQGPHSGSMIPAQTHHSPQKMYPSQHQGAGQQHHGPPPPQHQSYSGSQSSQTHRQTIGPPGQTQTPFHQQAHNQYPSSLTPHSSQTPLPPHSQAYHQYPPIHQTHPRSQMGSHYPMSPGPYLHNPLAKPKLEPSCSTPGPRFPMIGPKPEKPPSGYSPLTGNLGNQGQTGSGHNHAHGPSPMGNTCTYPYPHSNNGNSNGQSDHCQTYMMSSVPVPADSSTYTMMSFRHFGSAFALHSYDEQQQHATLGLYQPAGPLIQTMQHDPCCMPDHMAMIVPRPQVKVLVHNTGSYSSSKVYTQNPEVQSSQASKVLADKPLESHRLRSPSPKHKDGSRGRSSQSPVKKSRPEQKEKPKESKKPPSEVKDKDGKVFTTLEVPAKKPKNADGRELLARMSTDSPLMLQPNLSVASGVQRAQPVVDHLQNLVAQVSAPTKSPVPSGTKSSVAPDSKSESSGPNSTTTASVKPAKDDTSKPKESSRKDSKKESSKSKGKKKDSKEADSTKERSQPSVTSALVPMATTSSVVNPGTSAMLSVSSACTVASPVVAKEPHTPTTNIVNGSSVAMVTGSSGVGAVGSAVSVVSVSADNSSSVSITTSLSIVAMVTSSAKPSTQVQVTSKGMKKSESPKTSAPHNTVVTPSLLTPVMSTGTTTMVTKATSTQAKSSSSRKRKSAASDTPVSTTTDDGTESDSTVKAGKTPKRDKKKKQKEDATKSTKVSLNISTASPQVTVSTSETARTSVTSAGVSSNTVSMTTTVTTASKSTEPSVTSSKGPGKKMATSTTSAALTTLSAVAAKVQSSAPQKTSAGKTSTIDSTSQKVAATKTSTAAKLNTDKPTTTSSAKTIAPSTTTFSRSVPCKVLPKPPTPSTPTALSLGNMSTIASVTSAQLQSAPNTASQDTAGVKSTIPQLPPGAIIISSASNIAQSMLVSNVAGQTTINSSPFPLVSVAGGQLVTPVFLPAKTNTSATVTMTTASVSLGVSGTSVTGGNVLSTAMTSPARLPFVPGQFQVAPGTGNITLSNVLPSVFLSIPQGNTMGQTFLQLGAPRQNIQQLAMPMVAPQQMMVTQGTQVATKPVQGQANKAIQPIAPVVKTPQLNNETDKNKDPKPEKVKSSKKKPAQPKVKSDASKKSKDTSDSKVADTKTDDSKKLSKKKMKSKKSNSSATSSTNVTSMVSSTTTTTQSVVAPGGSSSMSGQVSSQPVILGQPQVSTPLLQQTLLAAKSTSTTPLLQSAAAAVAKSVPASTGQLVKPTTVASIPQLKPQKTVADTTAKKKPSKRKKPKEPKSKGKDSSPELDQSGALNLSMSSPSAKRSTQKTKKTSTPKAKKAAVASTTALGVTCSPAVTSPGPSSFGMKSPVTPGTPVTPIRPHVVHPLSPFSPPGFITSSPRTSMSESMDHSYEDLIQDLSMPRPKVVEEKALVSTGSSGKEQGSPIDLRKCKDAKGSKTPKSKSLKKADKDTSSGSKKSTSQAGAKVKGSASPKSTASKKQRSVQTAAGKQIGKPQQSVTRTVSSVKDDMGTKSSKSTGVRISENTQQPTKSPSPDVRRSLIVPLTEERDKERQTESVPILATEHTASKSTPPLMSPKNPGGSKRFQLSAVVERLHLANKEAAESSSSESRATSGSGAIDGENNESQVCAKNNNSQIDDVITAGSQSAGRSGKSKQNPGENNDSAKISADTPDMSTEKIADVATSTSERLSLQIKQKNKARKSFDTYYDSDDETALVIDLSDNVNEDLQIVDEKSPEVDSTPENKTTSENHDGTGVNGQAQNSEGPQQKQMTDSAQQSTISISEQSDGSTTLHIEDNECVIGTEPQNANTCAKPEMSPPQTSKSTVPDSGCSAVESPTQLEGNKESHQETVEIEESSLEKSTVPSLTKPESPSHDVTSPSTRTGQEEILSPEQREQSPSCIEEVPSGSSQASPSESKEEGESKAVEDPPRSDDVSDISDSDSVPLPADKLSTSSKDNGESTEDSPESEVPTTDDKVLPDYKEVKESPSNNMTEEGASTCLNGDQGDSNLSVKSGGGGPASPPSSEISTTGSEPGEKGACSQEVLPLKEEISGSPKKSSPSEEDQVSFSPVKQNNQSLENLDGKSEKDITSSGHNSGMDDKLEGQDEGEESKQSTICIPVVVEPDSSCSSEKDSPLMSGSPDHTDIVQCDGSNCGDSPKASTGKRSPTAFKETPQVETPRRRSSSVGRRRDLTSPKSPDSSPYPLRSSSLGKGNIQSRDLDLTASDSPKRSPGKRGPTSSSKKLPEESPKRTSPRVQASSSKKDELTVITDEPRRTGVKRKDDSPTASPPSKRALISPKKKEEKKSGADAKKTGAEQKKTSPVAKRKEDNKPYIPWKCEGEPEMKLVYTQVEGPPVMTQCYSSIRHDDGDVIRVRDCVLVKSGPRKSDIPYVAKIGALFKDPQTDELLMSVLWYYRAEHTETERLPQYIDCEIFGSKHRDIIPAVCIDDRCYVLTCNEYCRFHAEQKRVLQGYPARVNIVPPSDPAEYSPRPDRIPPVTASVETVFLCRRVYDIKLKRVLKNPQVHVPV